jgi:dGTP triphosphohydrolase
MMVPVYFHGANHKDQFTNRKSHTLFVKYIARKIAESECLRCAQSTYQFKLDFDLIDCIASSHDIGHTPFGHAGEEELHRIIRYIGPSYSEEFPGYFKHNINSARLLLSNYPYCSWKIIDGALKHSDIFYNNFDFLAVNGTNLLKMNYVFRQDQFSNLKIEPNFHGFLKNLSQIEKSPSPGETKNPFCSGGPCANLKKTLGWKNPFCYCPKNKSFISIPRINSIDDAVAAYLLFPNPLTMEGAIVCLADEIASFISDLVDYFSLISFSSPQIDKKGILFSQIRSDILVATSKYKSPLFRQVCSNLLVFLMKLKQRSGSNEVESNRLIDSILLCLEVPELKKTSIDQGAFLAFSNDGSCKPLLCFGDPFSFLHKNIKNSIYSFVHDDPIITCANRLGQNLLSKRASSFIASPKKSIEREMTGIGSSGSIAFYKNYFEASYLIITKDLDKKPNLGGFVSSCLQRVQSVAEDAQLSDVVLGVAKEQTDASVNKTLLENLFVREVCYYLASLSDFDFGTEKYLAKRLSGLYSPLVSFKHF